MRLRVHQVRVRLEYTPEDVTDAVAQKMGCLVSEIGDESIVRRSVDARHRTASPRYVLSVLVEYTGKNDPPLRQGAVELVPAESDSLRRPVVVPRKRPLVIGAGPAGLMAALTLAEAGAHPLLIERGDPVEPRQRSVAEFWGHGILDPESNVLYGEGGAGLFSDGKLTSRSKERGAVRDLFDTWVACGAPRDILLDAEPHLGSDVLIRVTQALRERIVAKGGEILYRTALTGIYADRGMLRGAVIGGKEVDVEACLLATGHSARDVFALLADAGVPMEPKPFAIGVRAEMPQEGIDVAQYGRWANHPSLPRASFRLTRRQEADARACYSFCMCPGGTVMACASSEGRVTTNGMSYSGRAKLWGNAAFLVPVHPEEFTGDEICSPLDGVRYQETLERRTFDSAGGGYMLPAQRFEDFLQGRDPRSLPQRRSCARSTPVNLADLLPGEIYTTLRRAMPKMLSELRGIERRDVLVYGVESRSSSPVRIVRHPATYQSTGLKGLLPVGEGAGHAGGIVSSALDGMAAAHALLEGAHGIT